VRRVDVMAKIDYGIPLGAQEIGGFEIGTDSKNPPENGEISMGGDSGSAWLIADGRAATDIFAGLHFAGESGDNPDEHALACYALSVQKKLDFVLEPPAVQTMADDQPQAAVPRVGYDPGFLGVDVPLPKMSLSLKRDAVNFGRLQIIPYTHFSVCLSAKRRVARFVAWNIDGARKVVLPRRDFKLDPRINAQHQIGNEVYVDNVLDRGHIARRADLAWGPVPEADQANRDSFFYTNIAPQHQRFNQSEKKGLWGRLENSILEQADVQDIKVSAIAGPFFADDDIPYRGALVPRSYWKLVAYVDCDGDLRVAAFVLSQADLLHDLEGLDLDPFRLFQISISELSERTTLDFSALEPVDVISRRDRPARGERAESLMDARRRVVEILDDGDLLL
jgi:endonuclease G